jgi:hypothetical protein
MPEIVIRLAVRDLGPVDLPSCAWSGTATHLTGSLAQSSKDLVITQVDNVVTNDCGSVNPNS